MSEQGWMFILGFIVLVFQAIVAVQVSSLKETFRNQIESLEELMREKLTASQEDRANLWKKLYAHSHDVQCHGDGSRGRTTSVSWPTGNGGQ